MQDLLSMELFACQMNAISMQEALIEFQMVLLSKSVDEFQHVEIRSCIVWSVNCGIGIVQVAASGA